MDCAAEGFFGDVVGCVPEGSCWVDSRTWVLCVVVGYGVYFVVCYAIEDVDDVCWY